METPNLASLVIAALSAIIAFTALYSQWNMRRPKIQGRVNQVVLKRIRTPVDPEGKQTLAILVHISLTNRGRDPIYVMEYDIDCDTGQGYRRLERFQYVTELTLPPIQGFKVEVDDWRKLQVFYPYRPVEFGSPLTGFLVGHFSLEQPMANPQADIEKHLESIRRVSVTLKDVFHKSTQFHSSRGEFIHPVKLLWLLEMAGAKIHPQKTKDTQQI